MPQDLTELKAALAEREALQLALNMRPTIRMDQCETYCETAISLTKERDTLRQDAGRLREWIKKAAWLAEYAGYENEPCRCEQASLGLPEYSHPGYYCESCQWVDGMAELRAEVSRIDAALKGSDHAKD
jgi:hypothetical protein